MRRPRRSRTGLSTNGAIDAQYRAIRQSALGLAARLSGDHDLADDLFHSAVAAALERGEQGHAVGPGWIMGKVRWLAMQQERDAATREDLLVQHAAPVIINGILQPRPPSIENLEALLAGREP